MIEALALVTLRQRLPIELSSLQQRQRTHHVGLGKRKRVLDRAVHMALSSQMDDAIDLLVLHQLIESVEIADIHLHELVVWFVLNILQVSEITRIRQLIEVDDVVIRILVHEKANYMASDKACTTGNDNCSFHNILILNS